MMSEDPRVRQEALRQSVVELVEAVEVQGKEIDRQGHIIESISDKIDQVVVQQVATSDEVKRLDRRLYVDNGGRSVLGQIADNRHSIELLEQASTFYQQLSEVKDGAWKLRIEHVKEGSIDWKWLAIIGVNAALAVLVYWVNTRGG